MCDNITIRNGFQRRKHERIRTDRSSPSRFGSKSGCGPRQGPIARHYQWWGKKKLAYAIRREDFAVYVYFEVKLPSSAPLKISSVLNITDEVLRYLLVKTDEKTRQALAEQKEREAKVATEAADKEA